MSLSPEPLEVEHLISEDQRRPAFPNSARAKCIKQIVANIGEGGFREFLRQPQPDFSDMSGAEILERQPAELLRRLEKLEAVPDLADVDEEIDERIECDPYLDTPPSRRSDKELARVLDLLDNLEVDGRDA